MTDLTCNMHHIDPHGRPARCDRPAAYTSTGDGVVRGYCAEHGRWLQVRYLNGTALIYPQPINEAETLGRVTGSVAATVVHQTRNADGTLTETDRFTWTRDQVVIEESE